MQSGCKGRTKAPTIRTTHMPYVLTRTTLMPYVLTLQGSPSREYDKLYRAVACVCALCVCVCVCVCVYSTAEDLVTQIVLRHLLMGQWHGRLFAHGRAAYSGHGSSPQARVPRHTRSAPIHARPSVAFFCAPARGANAAHTTYPHHIPTPHTHTTYTRRASTHFCAPRSAALAYTIAY